VGKREIYISSEEIHKSKSEICISLADLYISSREIHKLTREIHILLEDLRVSLEDLARDSGGKGPAVKTAGNSGQNRPSSVGHPVGAGRLRHALPAVSTAGPKLKALPKPPFKLPPLR